jgi:hypothetical protein
MNSFLSQHFILARSQDVEGWVNILIIVALAAFWAIGGILKARAEQNRMQKGEKTPPKPIHRPSPLTRESAESILEKFLGLDTSNPPVHRPQRSNIHTARPRVSYPRPANERFSAKPKPVKSPTYQNINITQSQELKLPQIMQEKELQQLEPLKTNLQELPEFSAESVQQLESLSPQSAKGISMPQIPLDLTDSGSLRRAILYYEILGRPLSLRDPSEFFTGM